jgi:hypothetical protein
MFIRFCGGSWGCVEVRHGGIRPYAISFTLVHFRIAA